MRRRSSKTCSPPHAQSSLRVAPWSRARSLRRCSQGWRQRPSASTTSRAAMSSPLRTSSRATCPMAPTGSCWTSARTCGASQRCWPSCGQSWRPLPRPRREGWSSSCPPSNTSRPWRRRAVAASTEGRSSSRPAAPTVATPAREAPATRSCGPSRRPCSRMAVPCCSLWLGRGSARASTSRTGSAASLQWSACRTLTPATWR
mmetsp:Transcript_55604/g.143207  ORF Transcript_55604/g.143207 Transcript_55604/m.143207 type:complete len:202 (+) Transcript_55604:1565-2170(+)